MNGGVSARLLFFAIAAIAGWIFLTAWPPYERGPDNAPVKPKAYRI
jgi:hypothetical protein